MLRRRLGRGFCSLTALLLLFVWTGPVAGAVSSDALKQLQYPFYDPNSSANASCSDSSVLVGSDNEDKTWNYFKAKGLSDAQVAGVMGNLQQESSFNPLVMQKGGQSQTPSDADPLGWGLIQWTPGSKVVDLANQADIGGPIYELATQLDLTWQHMNNHPVVTGIFDLAHFKQITSETEAAGYFRSQIEGGTDPNGIRETYATAILQKYGGNGASPSGAGASCGSSLSPDCQSAAGVAKILCAAKQYDSVSYSETVAGGHQGGAAWHASCPTIGPSCVLDCSGLVNIAVYDVYHTDLKENTFSEASDSQYWRKVSFGQLQPGDLIQPGSLNGGHVEIVDHVRGSTIYTFGAHTSDAPQPDQISPTNYSAAVSDVYLHYVGPGA